MGRLVMHWVCVIGLAAVPLVGCTDVVEFQTYSFTLTESLPDLTVTLSQGVEICEADTENCVMTDATGRAELSVLSNQEVTFTFEKEGYGPLVAGDVSDETFGPDAGGTGAPTPARMYPHEQLEAIAHQLGTPYPWEGGIVGLGTPAGVTFTPVGSTIDSVGEPFYFDAETSRYSLDLEATTAGGPGNLLPHGDGGFTEVAPGEQQFELGGTAGDCSGPSYGWPVPNEPNQIRVPVRDGYRTYGSIFCP